MKITIYTAADKRPDFISVQHRSLKKFLKDDYELVVLNNSLDSKARREEISGICKDLGIKCIEVKKDTRFTVIGGQKAFTWLGSYKNANVGTAYPIKWAWEMMCEENKGELFAIMDSDMFLCRDISFSDEIGDLDASFIIQYRGLEDGRKKANVTYIWNAFCIFNPGKIKNIKDMNWDCGIIKKSFINGYPVDVGGYIHPWLQQNNISFRHISEYALHKFRALDDGRFYLEATLNGNYHFSFEYDPKSRETSDYKCHEGGWQQRDIILPHLPADYESILREKIIGYFEAYICDKQSYPFPTFIGFLEFENMSPKNDPFIIHSKGGSGYMGFGEEYGKLKLDFIQKILNI